MPSVLIALTRAAWRLSGLVACVSLSACIETTGYRFPPELENSKVKDILYDDNGHLITWKESNLAPFEVEKKKRIIQQLKAFYP